MLGFLCDTAPTFLVRSCNLAQIRFWDITGLALLYPRVLSDRTVSWVAWLVFKTYWTYLISWLCMLCWAVRARNNPSMLLEDRERWEKKKEIRWIRSDLVCSNMHCAWNCCKSRKNSQVPSALTRESGIHDVQYMQQSQLPSPFHYPNLMILDVGEGIYLDLPKFGEGSSLGNLVLCIHWYVQYPTNDGCGRGRETQSIQIPESRRKERFKGLLSACRRFSDLWAVRTVQRNKVCLHGWRIWSYSI